ncbi:MAG: sensor histidine kinase, partial [Sphingobacterium sp.]
AFTNEHIANFKYNASYAAIKNNDYDNLVYLNIPYFTSIDEENESQNLLLNTLLNIYTIIILVMGFLTVLIANSITKPLSLIGQKLSQTIFSNKPNEALYWEKDDEIGALVKEYNYMIVKLEENAKQLRNAERDYAWREMAKQIAHEIKNPLTPMKLGIQQLSRSYAENDPKFEERFHKISNSFIVQINSLSKIATEFSNFAKLPDTILTKINIIEIISKSATIYHNNQNTYIKILNNTDQEKLYVLGDRDQLLRSFNNLIKNAIEASIGRKKHLTSIIVDYAEIGKIKVIVKDNGMGIPAQVLPKIFQPNFTTKSSGTGLGLAFVKKTVESLKGEISFTTYEGIGTTFTIVLPLYDETDKLEQSMTS